MKPADDIEKIVNNMSFRAGSKMDRAIWADALKAQRQSQGPQYAPGRDRVGRTVMAYPVVKLALAAAIMCAAIVLWRTMPASKTYALSDIPELIGQAWTIHIRSRQFIAGEELLSEYWYDAEKGKKYVYTEDIGPPGQRIAKHAIETVWNEPFVMRVNHRKRSVRFQRLLPSEQELHRLVIRDFALHVAFEDHQALNQYAKIGKERISGQSYDVWRREFRDTDTGLRLEVLVSPRTGDIARIRRWINHYQFEQGWMLHTETDAVEIDVLPPWGIFSTLPPAGYTQENSKTTADPTGVGYSTYQHPEGYELRVPLSLVLEDGSVLACWSTTSDSVEPPANDAYENLMFGEALPETPCALCGLISIGAMKPCGLLSAYEKDTPMTIIHYRGRHVAHTYSTGKVYEWGLYVPQREVSNGKPIRTAITVVRSRLQGSEAWRPMLGKQLTSLVVTPQSFTEYVAGAVAELSEDGVVPAVMAYENLLELAKHVRDTPGGYDNFKDELKEEIERSVNGVEVTAEVYLEPVDTATSHETRQ